MSHLSSANDPIENLIDRQLASLWLENMGVGGRSSAWVTKGSGDKVLTNYMEDMFIDAFDKKYHGARRKESMIMDQIEEGLTEAETAAMVGTSERNVRRTVKKFREEADED